MNYIAEQIKALELKLLHADLAANPTLLDELLSDNFEEIGETGYVSSRREVVEWLTSHNNAQWLLTNFRLRMLSDDLVLAVYQAQKINNSIKPAKISIRSSIWKRDGRHWQMVFHQGSRLITDATSQSTWLNG